MNPFVNRISNQNWILPVTGMSLVLGFMVATAWVTPMNRKSRYQFLPGDQKQRVSAAQVDVEEFEKLQEEVNKLREKSTTLENALADRDKGSKALNDQLQEMKTLACLTEVEGPGAVVTLRDSAKAGPAGSNDLMINPDSIIHDTDVQKVVNELYGSGAEAVTINNIRLASTSTIRCVGPTIQIDGVPVASPIYIRAIGDPETLVNGVNLPGGPLSVIRSLDPSMVTVEKVAKMRMPAFGGGTARKHLTSVKANK